VKSGDLKGVSPVSLSIGLVREPRLKPRLFLFLLSLPGAHFPELAQEQTLGREHAQADGLKAHQRYWLDIYSLHERRRTVPNMPKTCITPSWKTFAQSYDQELLGIA
jgi:hypothetical protein